jgi:hypothetical protein
VTALDTWARIVSKSGWALQVAAPPSCAQEERGCFVANGDLIMVLAGLHIGSP